MNAINWDMVAVIVFALWALTFAATLAARAFQSIFGRAHRNEERDFLRSTRQTPRRPLTPEEMERARRFAKVITDGPQPCAHPDVCSCGGKCHPVDS